MKPAQTIPDIVYEVYEKPLDPAEFERRLSENLANAEEKQEIAKLIAWFSRCIRLSKRGFGTRESTRRGAPSERNPRGLHAPGAAAGSASYTSTGAGFVRILSTWPPKTTRSPIPSKT